MGNAKYKRVVLKLSGEALAGNKVLELILPLLNQLLNK